MRYHGRAATLALAAIPYLLLSSSEQAGIRTHVAPDGSGERAVWARSAPGRTDEAARYLATALPTTALRGMAKEGDSVLIWRDAQVADAASLGEAEATCLGIVQAPLSIFTTHTWKETLKFDRGDATDVEIHGQGLAKLKYIVEMPGTITSQSPPAKVEGNVAEWDVPVGDETAVYTVESRTIRWPYLVLWVWVLLFVISKAIVYAPKAAGKIRRKPRKI